MSTVLRSGSDVQIMILHTSGLIEVLEVIDVGTSERRKINCPGQYII